MNIEEHEDEFGNDEEINLGENGEEVISIDRLSALPNDLLLHIFCIIDFNANEAATTGVLSTRWRYLWRDMPRLRFFQNSRNPEEKRNFVISVHKALILRRESLEQFWVQFRYDVSHAEDVNAWVRFAVKNKVTDLSLALHKDSGFYTPPQVLYSGPFLKQLYLQGCIVPPPRTIGWSCLTTLKVWDAVLPQEALEKILSGCPVLYGLELGLCSGFNSVNSERLRDISVLYNDVDMLEISAPNLKTLHISCYPRHKRVQLMNEPPLLASAEIQFIGFVYPVDLLESMIDLLEKTQSANLLVLGGSFVQALSEFEIQDQWFFPQSRRAQLTLKTKGTQNCLPGTIALIRSSTNLEELIIECSDEEFPLNWVPPATHSLDHDYRCLNTVCLLHIADGNPSGEPTLTLSRFLLERATWLETMEIKIGGVGSSSPFFTNMSETVLGYPRCSENAKVIFKQLTHEDY